MATYYVDQAGGSDAAAGTSPGTAWKTVAKVNASVFSPGDDVRFIRNGVWHETLAPPSSGTAGNMITFADYGSGAKPIFDGRNAGVPTRTAAIAFTRAYVTLQNLDARGAQGVTNGCILLYNCNHCDVLDCNVQDTEGDGITVAGSSTVVRIGRSTVSYCGGDGLTLYQSTNGEIFDCDVHHIGVTQDDVSGISVVNSSYGWDVHDNLCHDSLTVNGGVGTRGIIADYIGSAGVNWFYRNRCWNLIQCALQSFESSGQIFAFNLGYGITKAFGAVMDTSVAVNPQGDNAWYNNTLIGQPSGGGACFTQSSQTVSPTIYKNNLCYAGAYAIQNYDAAGGGAIWDYNLAYGFQYAPYHWDGVAYASAAAFFGATGQGQHDVNADPLLVNAGASDYRIGFGSPCIHAGVTVP